jgi:hypothetical protein
VARLAIRVTGKGERGRQRHGEEGESAALHEWN